jgi:hypothetical protein
LCSRRAECCGGVKPALRVTRADGSCTTKMRRGSTRGAAPAAGRCWLSGTSDSRLSCLQGERRRRERPIATTEMPAASFSPDSFTIRLQGALDVSLGSHAAAKRAVAKVAAPAITRKGPTSRTVRGVPARTGPRKGETVSRRIGDRVHLTCKSPNHRPLPSSRRGGLPDTMLRERTQRQEGVKRDDGAHDRNA